MTRSHALVLALVATAVAVGSGCAEDDGPPSDSIAGTGSSGGNPATVRFALETDAEADREAIDFAQLSAGVVEFARIDAAGECRFSPGEVFALGAFVGFDGSQALLIDVDGLCRVRFRPPSEHPLVQMSVERARALQVFIDLFLPSGVDIVVDLPSSGSAQTDEGLAEDELEIVVVLLGSPVLEAIQRANLGADAVVRLSELDPEFGAQILDAILSSIVLYLDPTPGDARVTAAERTPERVVGRIERADVERFPSAAPDD